MSTFIAVTLALFAFSLAFSTFAHAETRDTVRTASSTKSELRKAKVTKDVDLTCMQTAVDARETSLLVAFGVFHDDLEEGLATRKDALHSAWGLTSGAERTKALQNAWRAWKSVHKDAFSALRSSRKSAWETFRGTVKTTCKESLPKEEALTPDSAGSISI